MTKVKKVKSKGFYPTIFHLRKVHRHLVKTLKPEEVSELERQIPEIAKKECLREPHCEPCWNRHGLEQGIKEIANVKIGRPAKSKGGLTLSDLREIAAIIGIGYDQLNGVNRAVWWLQIVEKVKQEEDNTLNRLKKLWSWMEKRITNNNIDWLRDNAPGTWGKGMSCLDDQRWRIRYLTNIFAISLKIQNVVDAKLNSEQLHSSVGGLSKNQLLVIAHKIMDLKLPNNATKEVMWKNILQKIEDDKGPFVSTVGIPPGYQGTIV